MYNAFWGLRENPFSLVPNPAFLYRSKQHEEALANLVYGVQNRKGLMVLTGEVGTGKTTILECLQDFLNSREDKFVLIDNSRITLGQFFETIACDLDLGCNPASKTEILFLLNGLLLQQAGSGQTTALIVDEAQDLPWDLLEEIRLLGNLQNRSGHLLQIVLAGQPEFGVRLDAPDLRQLKQRVLLRCNLRPLQEADTLEYITMRLERAGMPSQTVFPPGLMAEIHRRSEGIPRVVNTICDNLLLTAYALNSRTATTEMLAEVCADLHLDGGGGSGPDDCAEKVFGTIAGGPQGSPRIPAMAPSVALPPVSERRPPDATPRFELLSDAGHTALIWVAAVARMAIRRRTLVWAASLACVSLIGVFLKQEIGWLDTSLRAAVSLVDSVETAQAAPPAEPKAKVELIAGRKIDQDSPPRPLRIVPAEYTAAARYAQFRGKVFVVVTVDRHGDVSRFALTAPVAFGLDARITEVVPDWQFKPAMHNGNAVESRTLVEVPFR